ncbi:Ciliogenesis-associated TTC17-interacting protein [Geodia barretti]|uniref:Ciliogenesis-associated TTC17-interacting protein n=1 Tax=Geodia barretti TaxID=519541 RepID=A0AA35WQM1_GEOBA|nr:Ciliogenesis-associated TTC17-interacting protein [Geodia barretti]
MHTMEQGVDDSGRDQDAGNGENLLEAETRAPSLPGYLPWEQDLQMVSTFLDKKEDLKDSYHEYMRQNPELRAMLADFMQALLIQKPDDVYEFARDFFAPFAKDAVPKPSYPSHHV